MKLTMNRPEIPLFLLSAIAVIGVIVLTGMHLQVPDVLNTLAVASLVGGGAITQSKTPPPAV